MRRIDPSPLLVLSLRVDAVVSAAAGLLTLMLPERLQALMGAPLPWIIGIGVFMLTYGVVIGWLSARRQLPIAAAWTVVIGNLLWALESVLLAGSGWIDPTPAGLTLLLGQAAAVGGLAALQLVGLRASRSPMSAGLAAA